ncbi:hypothetical protein RKY76_00800, partial [Streptococcus pneumoniae]|nr:hypothetical protein [Streptococcus pneumoniae]
MLRWQQPLRPFLLYQTFALLVLFLCVMEQFSGCKLQASLAIASLVEVVSSGWVGPLGPEDG